MYLKNYEAVNEAIESIDADNYRDFLLLAVDAGPIQKMFIQRLTREINGKVIDFLSIRDVIIKNDERGKHIFSNILSKLEDKQIPIMVDDIINDKLDQHLMNNGYISYNHLKNGTKTRSRYKLGKFNFNGRS